MHILIFYIPIAVAVILPLLFPRAYGGRVISVVILCAVALLHFSFLMTEHRLVIDDGVRQLVVAPGSQMPQDFRVAVDSVQKYSQQEMWPFAVLTVALASLALFPFGNMKNRKPDDQH